VEILAPLRLLDGFQRRHRTPAVAIAVVKKASEDGAGATAALISYYGFLSIFPLLLAGFAILGFVAEASAGARKAILASVLRELPVFKDSISQGHITGSGLGLAVGVVGALWAGLSVTVVLQRAFNMVNCVPYYRRANFFQTRLRGGRLLLAVGVLEVVATGLTGLISTGFGGVVLVIAGILVSLAVNALLFFVAFRVLSDTRVPTRDLWPGIILATAGWELLQALGGIYVDHVLRSASATYGSFATVIGLLAWLILGARIVVYGAELNNVVAHHYWPRSLIGPETEADRAVRRALAAVEQSEVGESIEVRF
jgi:YihY family inner membrane protein